VAVSDFNGDAIQDLAVAASGFHYVYIFLGEGNGRFAPARTLNVGHLLASITSADFDGDGYQDLAVVDGETNTALILMGRGDGTFGPPQSFAVGVAPRFITTGDLNGDGIPDLAVANTGQASGTPGTTVSVLLGLGDGTFQSARDFKVGRGPRSVVVGDFNGDGRPDLAVANWDSWGCRLRYWTDISGFCGSGTTVSVLLNETSGPTNDAPSRLR